MSFSSVFSRASIRVPGSPFKILQRRGCPFSALFPIKSVQVSVGVEQSIGGLTVVSLLCPDPKYFLGLDDVFSKGAETQYAWLSSATLRFRGEKCFVVSFVVAVA